MRKWIILGATHFAMLGVGFAAGVYTLPILTAEAAPDAATVQTATATAQFTGTFTRDLKGSDALHWGEGKITVTPTQIIHEGALSPGPDFKLYLTKGFVEDEDSFNKIKAQSVRVGDVKGFKGVIVNLPAGVNPADYDTVVIWCEAFGEFITAAKYR